MHTVIEQRERRNTILAGGLIGLVVAGALALASTLPPAIADEQPFRTLLSTGEELMPDVPLRPFFKPHWTIEPSVNTDIVKQVTVRKIGYGRTEFVDIVTTPTGTYSSDAIVSGSLADAIGTNTICCSCFATFFSSLKPAAAHSSDGCGSMRRR